MDNSCTLSTASTATIEAIAEASGDGRRWFQLYILYDRDFTDKLEEYTRFPSLEAYIIASQDEPICWIWERDASTGFPAKPVEIAGRDSSIALAGRAIALPPAELYLGVAEAPA